MTHVIGRSEPSAPRLGRRKHSSRRRLQVAAASAAAAALLAACGSTSHTSSGSNGGGSSSSSSTPSITVGGFDVPATMSIYYAATNGFFKKVGLNLTVKTLTAAEFVPAVTSGQVDVSFSAMPAVLLAAGKGLPVRFLFQATTLSPADCPLAVQVAPSSHIDSLAELKGATIAIDSQDSAEELDLTPLLQAHGVKVADVKFLPVGAVGLAALAALDKGTATAMVQTEPYSTLLPAEHKAKDVSSLCVAPAPAHYGNSGYFTTSSYLAKHEATLKLFEEGMADAGVYINAHKEAYDTYLAGKFKLPVKVVESQHNGLIGVTDNVASYTYVKQAMSSIGLPVKSVDLSSFRVPLLTSGS